MISNGSDRVTIRTRHGAFEFVRRRVQEKNEPGIELFASLLSRSLQQTCLYWSGRLSFGEVAHLLTERCGVRVFSEDSLWRMVQEEAARLDAVQQQQIEGSASLPEPTYTAEADL